jgi:hypothetical protein
MATKPVSVYTHATDANFGTGPASGNPTKLPVIDAGQGFIPGEGIAAEPVNSLFSTTSAWLSWVQSGSFVATADAHLVETSLAGRVAVLGATIGGPTLDANTLVVQNQSPSDTATLVNASTGVGLRVTSAGIGSIIKGGGSNVGLDVTGGSFAGTGIQATGIGSGQGGFFTGGSLAEAATFIGVKSSNQPVVTLDRSGAGTLLRGAVYSPAQATPTGPVHGDWWTDEERFLSNVSAFSFAEGSVARRAWGTTEGYFYQHDENLGEVTTTSVVFADTTVVQLTVVPTPGLYTVMFSCSGRSKDPGDPNIRIKFDTDAGKSADYEVPSDVGQNRDVSFCATWQLNITASTTMKIQVATAVGGQTVACRNAEITIFGAHDLKTGPP